MLTHQSAKSEKEINTAANTITISRVWKGKLKVGVEAQHISLSYVDQIPSPQK